MVLKNFVLFLSIQKLFHLLDEGRNRCSLFHAVHTPTDALFTSFVKSFNLL